MKTIHKIQNVIAVIALFMAARLATQLEITTNETISAAIRVMLTIGNAIGEKLQGVSFKRIRLWK